MKDRLLAYKVYLQTLINIREGNEVAGDREVLKILKRYLFKNKNKTRVFKRGE